jgi:hypothetical protein
MNGWNRTKGALAAPFFLCRVGRPTRAGDPQGAAGRPPRGRRAQGAEHDRDRPASGGADIYKYTLASGGADMQATDRLAGAQTGAPGIEYLDVFLTI